MARDGGAPTATIEDQAEEVPAASGDQPVDAEVMQSQLREKEQLVAALTERLEQAAEQLDRLRRTGVDRGRRPLGGGFPAEVIEDHKTTLEDLKRVIARWEDIQAGASLGRIETQITELRDLLAGSGHAGTYSAAQTTPHAASNLAPRATPASPPRERPADAVPSHSGAKPGGNAWWEAQKAALLGEPVAAEGATAPTTAYAAPGTESRAGDAPDFSGSDPLATLNIPDLPAPIDFENITLDDARAAIRERDLVIQQLREPLLLLKASGHLPGDLQSLDNVPAPLTARIAELEAQWQAKFRQVELDVSLERARLAREQAAVRQQQEALQKHDRRGGSAAKAAHDDPLAKGDESASSKRRWFRFMGKGDEDGGEAQGTDQDK